MTQYTKNNYENPCIHWCKQAKFSKRGLPTLVMNWMSLAKWSLMLPVKELSLFPNLWSSELFFTGHHQ